MIKVIVADDENLIRTAMATMIGLEDDIDVIGEARSGEEALSLARALKPDVVVMDLQLPGIDGIEAAAQLTKDSPVAVVIVTSHGRPGYLKRALAQGVLGFLPKTASAAALHRAIRTAYAGKRYVDQSLAAEAIIAGDSPLTPRESDVLRLAVEGASVEEIAKHASLAPGTARNYLSAATSKLGATNRYQAVTIARERGWI